MFSVNIFTTDYEPDERTVWRKFSNIIDQKNIGTAEFKVVLLLTDSFSTDEIQSPCLLYIVRNFSDLW